MVDTWVSPVESKLLPTAAVFVRACVYSALYAHKRYTHIHTHTHTHAHTECVVPERLRALEEDLTF